MPIPTSGFSLGYIYNGNALDSEFNGDFGLAVPAAGYDFLQGPIVDGDTLGMSSFVMGGRAMLPGIPIVPFLGLSALAGGLAYNAVKNRKERAEEKVAVKQAEEQEAAEPKEEPISWGN